jgi:ABC-2 type transport system ATP-binding protein
MSTHQMNQVEEMCQRILLMDHGQKVLYGSLNQIREDFAPNAVEVQMKGSIPEISGVERVYRQDGVYRLVLSEGVLPEQVIRDLVCLPQVAVQRFERVETSLDEIFVRMVGHPVEPEEGQA